MIEKVYSVFLKRTSTYFLAIVGASFFFERALDVGGEALFDKINEGKLWKHIKGKYEE